VPVTALNEITFITHPHGKEPGQARESHTRPPPKPPPRQEIQAQQRSQPRQPGSDNREGTQQQATTSQGLPPGPITNTSSPHTWEVTTNSVPQQPPQPPIPPEPPPENNNTDLHDVIDLALDADDHTEEDATTDWEAETPTKRVLTKAEEIKAKTQKAQTLCGMGPGSGESPKHHKGGFHQPAALVPQQEQLQKQVSD
jgi:hypothetical protein